MSENPLDSFTAKATWCLLVLLSTAALLAMLSTPNHTQNVFGPWFIIPILWMVFAVPATVILHGHALCPAQPASGDTPSTGDELRAARSVWGALTFGVFLSLAAALLAGSASPAVWPAAVQLMLLILSRPSR